MAEFFYPASGDSFTLPATATLVGIEWMAAPDTSQGMCKTNGKPLWKGLRWFCASAQVKPQHPLYYP